jgi:hypothetical protein
MLATVISGGIVLGKLALCLRRFRAPHDRLVCRLWVTHDRSGPPSIREGSGLCPRAGAGNRGVGGVSLRPCRGALCVWTVCTALRLSGKCNFRLRWFVDRAAVSLASYVLANAVCSLARSPGSALKRLADPTRFARATFTLGGQKPRRRSAGRPRRSGGLPQRCHNRASRRAPANKRPQPPRRADKLNGTLPGPCHG